MYTKDTLTGLSSRWSVIEAQLVLLSCSLPKKIQKSFGFLRHKSFPNWPFSVKNCVFHLFQRTSTGTSDCTHPFNTSTWCENDRKPRCDIPVQWYGQLETVTDQQGTAIYSNNRTKIKARNRRGILLPEKLFFGNPCADVNCFVPVGGVCSKWLTRIFKQFFESRMISTSNWLRGWGGIDHDHRAVKGYSPVLEKGSIVDDRER